MLQVDLDLTVREAEDIQRAGIVFAVFKKAVPKRPDREGK
jgi:hypothetical protein